MSAQLAQYLLSGITIGASYTRGLTDAPRNEFFSAYAGLSFTL